jgi:acetyl esterase/lipase
MSKASVLTRLSLALWSSLLLGCQSLLFTGLKVPTLSQKYERAESIQFAKEKKLWLDVFRPRGEARARIVFFYGGSWQNGKRGWYRYVGASLAERGFEVLIPDYRQSPQVSFPAFVEDAAEAVAFARSLDRKPLFLVGHSAGAHLLMMLATAPEYLAAYGVERSNIQGIVGIAGPYDFLPMTDPKVIRALGGDANARATQPIHFAGRGGEPPTLLLHGEADTLVYPRNSINLAARIKTGGSEVQLKLYPELGHVGAVMAFSPWFDQKAPVMNDTIAFIEALLERARS